MTPILVCKELEMRSGGQNAACNAKASGLLDW
jgi:hypothetical protein